LESLPAFNIGGFFLQTQGPIHLKTESQPEVGPFQSVEENPSQRTQGFVPKSVKKKALNSFSKLQRSPKSFSSKALESSDRKQDQVVAGGRRVRSRRRRRWPTPTWTSGWDLFL